MTYFLKKSTSARIGNYSYRFMLPILLLSGACSVHVQGATAPAAPITIALVEFYADGNSYSNTMKAELVGDMLLPALSSVCPDTPCVDRAEIGRMKQELSLGLSGQLSSGANLSIGKWAQADVIVNGIFRQTPKHEWVLFLELIDVQHGDLFETIRWPRTGALQTLDDFLGHTGKIANDLCPVLNRFRNKPDCTYIAPLFFHNAESYGRLDFFEHDLMKRLRAANDRNAPIRFLNFARAKESLDETDFILSGLVNTDLAEWSDLADCYVWGWYSETTPKDTPFNETIVELKGTVWNGKDAMREFSCAGSVRKLDQLASDIARRITEEAHAMRHSDSSQTSRKEAARILYRRAQKQMELGTRALMLESKTLPDEYHNRWQYGLQQLYTILFFDPSHKDARFDLALEKARSDYNWHMQHAHRTFWYDWRRSKAWTWYFEHGGELIRFDDRLIKSSEHFSIDNRSGFYQDTLDAYLRSALTMVEHIGDSEYPNDVPYDLPDSEWAAWVHEWITTLVRRIAYVKKNYPNWEIPPGVSYACLKQSLRYIDNVEQRKMIIEALLDDVMQDPAFKNNEWERKQIKQEVGRTYIAKGDTVKVTTSQPFRRKETPSSPPSVLPAANSVENLPETKILCDRSVLTISNGREIIFPEHHGLRLFSPQYAPGGKVGPNNMAILADQFYIIADRTLYGYSLTDHILTDYSPDLEEHFDCRDVITDGPDSLLLAAAFDGIRRFIPATRSCEKIDSRQGLPSMSIQTMVMAGEKLYAGGGESRRGMLAWHHAGQWQEVVLPAELKDPTINQFCPVTSFAVNESWHAINSSMGSAYQRLLIHNRKKDTWRECIHGLAIHVGEKVLDFNDRIYATVLAGDQLYLAIEAGVFTTDLSEKKLRWRTILKGDLTAGYSQNEMLWVCIARDSETIVARIDCKTGKREHIMSIQRHVIRMLASENHLVLVLNMDREKDVPGQCIIYDLKKP